MFLIRSDAAPAASSQKQYGAEYFEQRAHTSDNTFIRECKIKTFSHYLRMLAPHGEGHRLLEIGCSAGMGLIAALRLGWEAHGLDVSAEICNFARAAAPEAHIVCATMEEADLPSHHFDAIVMFDVIEHLSDPHDALNRLRAWLKPGGQILFVTPDAGSLSAQTLGVRWPHLFEEHVIVFSRSSLARALRQTGFEPHRARWAGKYVNLEMLIRHAQIHTNVFGAGILRWMGRWCPAPLRRLPVWFNIGEFYLIAVKPDKPSASQDVP